MESLGAVTRPKGWSDHYRPPRYARGIGRKANRADGIGSVWAGEQYSRTLSGSEIVSVAATFALPGFGLGLTPSQGPIFRLGHWMLDVGLLDVQLSAGQSETPHVVCYGDAVAMSCRAAPETGGLRQIWGDFVIAAAGNWTSISRKQRISNG
jgi:hypothetical protein